MIKMKLSLLILLTLFSLTLIGCGGSSRSESQQFSENCSLRITNGAQCAKGRGPVVFLLTHRGEKSFICTGAFIGKKEILTAAHCIDEDAERVEVYFGNKIVSTSTFYIHPDYQDTTLPGAASLNDIGVVVLPEEESGIFTLPVLTSQEVERDQTVTAFGYGQNENGLAPPDEIGFEEGLKSTPLTISAIYPDSNTFQAEYEPYGSITCFGDSGGPVIALNKKGVAGIVGVSHAVNHPEAKEADDVTCMEGTIGYFTSVQGEAALNFIQEVAPDIRKN